MQILHVLEPALQLAQLPYRLQTFYCWVSRSILISLYFITSTFQWHRHYPLTLQGITPPILNLNRSSPSTRRQFAVLMRSPFSLRTRSIRTSISLPSSPTAVPKLPSLTEISLSSPPYRNTNFRPSVLFPKPGPLYSFIFQFYFNLPIFLHSVC